MTTEFQIKIGQPVDRSYTFYMVDMDGHGHVCGFASTPQDALEKACAYLARKCSKCGWSLLNACDLGEKTCEWVKEDLCSGCAPKPSRRARAKNPRTKKCKR